MLIESMLNVREKMSWEKDGGKIVLAPGYRAESIFGKTFIRTIRS
jgi:hypothetical protein